VRKVLRYDKLQIFRQRILTLQFVKYLFKVLFELLLQRIKLLLTVLLFLCELCFALFVLRLLLIAAGLLLGRLLLILCFPAGVMVGIGGILHLFFELRVDLFGIHPLKLRLTIDILWSLQTVF